MSASLFNTPMLWINAYLKEKLESDLGFDTIPFFPATPSTLDELTQIFPDSQIMCTWDRMFRMRRSPFPHIKSEQALYYFYAKGDDPILRMIRLQENVLRLMDREDETAEEINNWAKGKTLDGMTCEFYFHRFKVYQLQEVRDIINFGTARTYAGNKVIIDFDYHQSSNITQ